MPLVSGSVHSVTLWLKALNKRRFVALQHEGLQCMQQINAHTVFVLMTRCEYLLWLNTCYCLVAFVYAYNLLIQLHSQWWGMSQYPASQGRNTKPQQSGPIISWLKSTRHSKHTNTSLENKRSNLYGIVGTEELTHDIRQTEGKQLEGWKIYQVKWWLKFPVMVWQLYRLVY